MTLSLHTLLQEIKDPLLAVSTGEGCLQVPAQTPAPSHQAHHTYGWLLPKKGLKMPHANQKEA